MLYHCMNLFQTNTELGEVMFSLSYLPTAERLTVVLVKARNLRFPSQKDAGDSFVKVRDQLFHVNLYIFASVYFLCNSLLLEFHGKCCISLFLLPLLFFCYSSSFFVYIVFSKFCIFLSVFIV